MSYHQGDHWEDAGLGWRVLATLIDSLVLFTLLVVLVGIAAATGSVQLPDPAATDPFDIAATQASMPEWMYYAVYFLLFAYYTVLEGIAGGSVGKLALGMRVHMNDGRRATGVAVVVRNLIRVPEALFYYLPSAIACLASKRHKRLGDFAAGTVVARRARVAALSGSAPTPPYGAPQRAPYGGPPTGPPPWPPTPAVAAPDSAPAPQPQGPTPSPMPASALPPQTELTTALARFKEAVLSAGGAHDTYLRFSELELAKEATHPGGENPYSPEYVAAWYSLSEAVHSLASARQSAEAASAAEGLSLEAAIANQADLVFLTRRLAPYLAAGADERLHEAYVEVVRSELRG